MPRYLREYLEAAPANSVQQVQGKWLLNLVHMTLGDHPEGVEPEYRLPLEAFGSGADFPRFKNVAPALGIDTFNLSGGAVVDDFDGDTDLDIFTTTFDPSGEPRFFVGDGAGGFEDRTSAAGLKGLYGGLNVVHGDYDNDGDLDLFVGNEHSAGQAAPLQLFRSEGAGEDGVVRFRDVAAAAGVEVRAFVKAAVWGDYDNDRFPDLYVSVLGGANRLYRNRGDGSFEDVAAELGVAGPRQSFPAWFWDVDNDGNLDLFVSSYTGDRGGMGFVAASYQGFPGPWELARLYRNTGGGRFENPGFGNRWLGLLPVGTESNRSAIGARIRVDLVDADDGTRSIHRRVGGGGSFGGNPLRQTIGLGRPASVEKVEVYWPTTDSTQTFAGVEMDRLYRVVEGAAGLEAVE